MMKTLGVILVCCLVLSCQTNAQTDKGQQKDFEVKKTEAQWKKELTPEQYKILRQAGTERPHSSELLKINKKEGVLECAACGNPVFKFKNKYDAHCGWPSFDRAIKDAVIYQTDYKLGYPRTEVLCAKCGSHLGHLFNDGPKNTTGKRYCIDGVALKEAENSNSKN